MSELTQKVALNEDGTGYYVLEREYDVDGKVVTLTSGDDVPQLQRDIIRMRAEMTPFRDIADQLNLSLHEVTNLYYIAMNRDYEQLVESMNAIRYSELMLIESQIKELLDLQRTQFDNLGIHDRLVMWLNRRSKLLGLDAPERFQAQVTVSSYEEQLQMLDAEYVEVISDALNKQHRKKT